jgi:diaminopimelate epimerase
MYVYEKQLQKYLFPVVYVRDIDTLIYETACGSGTIAASAVQMKRENMREWTREYIQPSNISLCASLRETETQLEVSISGCIDPRCLTGVIDTKV